MTTIDRELVKIWAFLCASAAIVAVSLKRISVFFWSLIF